MDQTELANAFRVQADWCGKLGSPLYHGLLLRVADDVSASGPCWSILARHAPSAERSLLPLRFLAAVHGLVLEDRLPALAPYYPSVGGAVDLAAAWPAFLDAIQELRDDLIVPETVQTNEVSRCCALLPGFIAIARHTGLPLRLLEIGCSAGLNLRWDRYAYRTARGLWGDLRSPVKFDDVFVAQPPPMDVAVSVSARNGCDLNPIDPTTEDGRLTLLSFVWPDQTTRFRNLANAIEVARRVPAELERSDAVPWLESRLARLQPGVATVLFHSLVLPYFSDEAKRRMDQILAEAKERASSDAPLAWLTMEPGEKEADVHLTMWPGGARVRIAQAGFHGRDVNILAS